MGNSDYTSTPGFDGDRKQGTAKREYTMKRAYVVVF
ncbi:hypothetical protein Holit_03266 [Hollandina sp. SP2]